MSAALSRLFSSSAVIISLLAVSGFYLVELRDLCLLPLDSSSSMALACEERNDIGSTEAYSWLFT